MQKFIRRFIPTNEAIKKQLWLKPFHGFLTHHNLWYLNRHSVSGAVAIGMFCGMLPPPFQIAVASLLAVVFRVNLPVAAFSTFYTNPLTLIPLYVLAYQLGAWLIGDQAEMDESKFQLPEFSLQHWDSWLIAFGDWLTTLGEPLLLGVLVMATTFSGLGYVVVRLAWRFWILSRWRKRHFKHPA